MTLATFDNTKARDERNINSVVAEYQSPLSTIEEALEDLRCGRMIVVVDDEDRENEGDLLMAAEKVTPQAVNFMSKYGRGLICVPLPAERLEELRIPMMVPAANNNSQFSTAFTVAVDARNTTTGISAHERATTIQALLDSRSTHEDFVMPGHIFPLRAEEGGVLVRRGHTEAAVDLARLANLKPGGVICEILHEDGTMARLPQLEIFAEQHNLKIISIADLVKYRRRHEKLVRRLACTVLPTKYGKFTIYAYEDIITKEQHVALTMGAIDDGKPVLLRMHSECLTGDVFGSLRCDCGDQLATAMQHVNDVGRGVILYLHQEGRGIGLGNKLRAYALQDQGMDTVEANESLGFPADMRDYNIAVQMLKDLHIHSVDIMTNNPQKVRGLSEYGMEIASRRSLQIAPTAENFRYLHTKCEKLGHRLQLP